MSDQNKNKILSLFLILLISFLSTFFYSIDLEFEEKLITIIPVFTILFSLYVYGYELKKIWIKILFALLIIASIIVLSLLWWIYEFAKGMGSN